MTRPARPAAPRPTALVDFRAPEPGAAPVHLAFGAPRERLVARTHAEVAPLLAQVDAQAHAGSWAVGYLRYEAAAAFDAALVARRTAADDALPLAAFAIHDAPLPTADPAAMAAWTPPPSATAGVRWKPGLERADFDRAIGEIHRAIADGELYQVNYTAPIEGELQGDPLALFAALRRAQPNAYAAWLDVAALAGGGEPGGVRAQILSVSPELFFDWRARRLLARPMKGTAARGATAVEDAAQAEHLRASPKERAENLMIVDLLRNDLSRVAEPFSVQVPRLFHTEAWPTVWQMSSDVVARTRAGVTLADVFAALFPCGSVTGAPKVQAMRVIDRLETAPRGVYCGAVGIVQPGGAATFNVPIRTLVVQGTAVRCGIGSGITADATVPGEWDEWRHKRAFVDRASQAFELVETLRLEQGRFVDAPAHLERMGDAAAHFGFVWHALAARSALDALALAHPEGTWRVRVLAGVAGGVRAEAAAFAAVPQLVRVRLARAPLVGSDGEFVRFKTTHRSHYDVFTPASPEVFDTLLWNERCELTEFTRGNVALCIEGRWLTPALACGLLPGVARARLLREGRIQEAVLAREDLARAEGVAFFNSLRGWLEAVPVDSPE